MKWQGGLVSNTSKTIGVIMPDILNPVFGEITTVIIETANDFDIFLCITNWDQDKEKQYLKTFKEKRVEGLIIKSTADTSETTTSRFNIPMVVFENWTKHHQFSSVSTDNFEGGYLAASHLIDYGYKNPVFLSGPAYSSSRKNRLDGFLKAYEDKNIVFNQDNVHVCDYNLQSRYKLSRQVLSGKTGIDSVFAGNDVIALGALNYLNEAEITPGKDMGIIGFDDITISGLPQIGLTTIQQPKYDIGRIITKLLLDEINNQKNNIIVVRQNILLKPNLIIRTTTCRH